ncbi:MAG: hypothetical protein ACRBF0_03215 [Calditrichia bacterium]
MTNYSDKDIQAYLDGSSEIDRKAFEIALSEDSLLKKRYENYSLLYGQLADDKGFMLSASFADNVMTQISGSDSTDFEVSDTTLIILATLVSFGTLIYLFFPEISNSTLLADSFGNLTSGFSKLPSSTGLSFNLIFITFLVLAGVAAMDKLIVEWRSKF